MNIEIRRSFEKDALKLPAPARAQLATVIQQITLAKTLSEIAACKKLVGYRGAYRIRMGIYRIGFFFEKGIVELVRVLGRKDLYKYFP